MPIFSIRDHAGVRPAAFSLAYFICAWGGQLLTAQPSPTAVFWPPAGLFLGVLLLSERSRWTSLVLAASSANILFDLLNHRPALASMGYALANSLEALAGAWLVETVLKGRFRRLGFKEAVALALCGALLSTALGAGAGAWVLSLTGQAASYYQAWRTWWSGGLAGVVVVAPLLLVWGQQPPGRLETGGLFRIVELAAMLICVTAFSWLTFGQPMEQGFIFRYPLILALFWAALRFGSPGIAPAGALAFAVSACLVVNGYNNPEHLVVPTESQVLGLHFFYGTLLLALLALSAAVSDRAGAVEALRASEAHYRYLFEHSLVPIAEINAEGTLTEVNPAFCAFCGERCEDLAGKRSIQDFVHQDDIETSRRLMRDLSCRAVDHFIQEKRYVTSSGAVLDAMAFVRGRHGANGALEGAMVSILDISGRKRQEESIRAALEEKEVLLKEIHHRVKNNLQIIISLLNLQEQGVQDAAGRSVLAESRGRVMSMAVIHEHLYRSRDMSRIGMEDYLREFLPRLAALYAGGRDIELDLRIVPAGLSLDQAIPFGLIMNELVTNALKHGLKDRRHGRISVHSVLDAGECVVMVEDDGGGVPEGFSLDAPDSLGMRIAGMLAGQLGGGLGLATRDPACFRLRFPLGRRGRGVT